MSKESPPIIASRKRALPTMRQGVKVFFITLLLALALHALTRTPFLTVWSRVGFNGAALLFAYVAAGALHPRWLAQWVAKLLAVIVTAPLATLVIYRLMESGKAAPGVDPTQRMYGYVALAVAAVICGVIVALVALRLESKSRERAERLQAELERSKLERELLDARLRLLQAQIEPHFLFNTLANIQALVESGSENAAPVLRHLIAYLRAAMPRLNDADATLGTELQLVRAYLELMHMRMPDRLQFKVDLPSDINNLAFPAMALLTLVENAVRHGIDPSTAGGSIDVGGALDAADGMVTLWVEDSGVGMSESASIGTGLTNLRTRLQAFFGPGARMELQEAAPHGLRVELIFSPRSTA